MSIPVTFTDNAAPDLEASTLNAMQRQLMEVAITSQPTTTYILTLADAGGVVEANHATVQIVVGLPPNTDVAFPVGTVVEIVRMGDAPVVIFPGTGVTIRSRANMLTIAAKYSSVSVRKRATNEWHLVGDLA